MYVDTCVHVSMVFFVNATHGILEDSAGFNKSKWKVLRKFKVKKEEKDFF